MAGIDFGPSRVRIRPPETTTKNEASAMKETHVPPWPDRGRA